MKLLLYYFYLLGISLHLHCLFPYNGNCDHYVLEIVKNWLQLSDPQIIGNWKWLYCLAQVYMLKHHCVCVCWVLYLPQDTHPSAVFSVHTSKGSNLSDILYFLVTFHGMIFSNTQTVLIFSDQAITKCSYIWFLVGTLGGYFKLWSWTLWKKIYPNRVSQYR